MSGQGPVPVVFGIIGAGGIANKLHLPQLTDLPDATVKRLSGRSDRLLSTLAERFGVPHWSHDHADILDDPEIDAVVVAFPHPLHVPLGLEALAAGKHVLILKPLIATLKSADRFVHAAQSSCRTVLFLPHFGPAVYAIRHEIAENAIGRVSGAHGRSSHG